MVNNFRKLPLLVKAIVIGLILAPFGNFAATFSALGVSEWYYPLNFIKYSLQVSLFDLVWNGLLFLSGCLLLLRRKLAWAMAVAAIFLALAANFVNWYLGRIEGMSTAVFLLASLGSLAMLGILFYFRYPHLDRRDRWLSKNDRLPVTVPVEVVRPAKGHATLINISSTGALLEMKSDLIGNFPVNTHLTFALPTGKHVQAQVVRLSTNSIGVHFDTPLLTEDLKF